MVDNDKLLKSGIESLVKNDHTKAEAAFNLALALNSEYPSFASIDAAVNEAAETKSSFALELQSRKALLCLGVLHAKANAIKKSEDYILDAAYSCQDGRVKLLAGWFYLAIPEAEFATALNLFGEAVQLEPILLHECDSRIDKFVSKREIEIFGGLKPYLADWNNFTRSVRQSPSSPGSASAGIADEFSSPLLRVLDGVFAASVSGFPARLKNLRF